MIVGIAASQRKKKSNKMPEEWTEPFQMQIIGFDEEQTVRRFIGWILQQQAPSERMLIMLLGLLGKRDGEPFRRMIDISDNNMSSDDMVNPIGEPSLHEAPLHDVSAQLAEQSYVLASTKFDEPQLAILAVHFLCRLCKDFPSVIDVLLRLSRLDELAHARVLRHGIAAGLPLEGDFDHSPGFLLEDFRVLIKRHHNGIVELLIPAFVVVAPLFNLAQVESVHQFFELIYLLSEFRLTKGDYWQVVKTPDDFFQIWQLYLQDETALEMHVRPVKLCIARAMEAIGELSKAREMFASCGSNIEDDHLETIDSCLSGAQVYVSAEFVMPVDRVQDLTTRELCDGKLALFYRQRSEGNHNILKLSFAVFDPESKSIVNCQLPDDGNGWRAVRVIPDPPSEPLRILVAPRSDTADEEDGMAFMSEMLGMKPTLSNTQDPAPPVERVELWEYGDDEWHEIKTRGCIPDRHVVTRQGGGCALLSDTSLIVLGGLQIGGGRDSSAGAYVLNLRSREWRRLSHPYRGLYMNSSVPRLPMYAAIFNARLDGRQMVAMLRQGTPEVNRKGKNELVEKYALDLFGPVQGAAQSDSFWFLDVPTSDRSGYVASLMNVGCIQVGSLALVMGSALGSNMVNTLQADGSTRMNFLPIDVRLPVSISALDLNNMEWRGTNIHNMGLLQDTDEYKLVKCSDPDKCCVVGYSNNGIRIYRISNLQSIRDSFTDPLGNRKRLTKKNSRIYQLKKAKKNRARPFRECAACHVFESTVDFKCCARCRACFYCSAMCQKFHWKMHHKHDCVPYDATAKNEAT